jgi:hypothetical protein
VRPDVIVLSEPGVDDDLSLFDGREPFGIEDFFSERAIKAFIISILGIVTLIADGKKMVR